MEDYLELVLIKSYKHLRLFERDWSTILKENINTNPFIEFEYVCRWWEVSGGNEEVEIYAVKEHNRMIAFFPFQSKKTWFGYIVSFLALKEVNYMDLIVRKRDLDRVIMFVLDAIINQKKSIVFQLHVLIESGATPTKLSNYLQARKMKEQPKSIVTSTSHYNRYTRNIVFSSNTIRAKTYRNFLWAKEIVVNKEIHKEKT